MSALPTARPLPSTGSAIDRAALRALVLDVDGTMYVQRPVRVGMALRLARATLASPAAGLRSWRVLHAYRAAQETLRLEGSRAAGEDQLRRAVDRSGVGLDEARACVARWMHEEPGPLLRRHRRAGLLELLGAARAAGVRIGVFSDYPAERKLAALGVDGLVDAVASAHDAGIGAFKPSPAGLLAVARALGVSPADCVYVGDRPEVDGAAAAAAGMPAFIVGGRGGGNGWDPIDSFPALARRLGLP